MFCLFTKPIETSHGEIQTTASPFTLLIYPAGRHIILYYILVITHLSLYLSLSIYIHIHREREREMLHHIIPYHIIFYFKYLLCSVILLFVSLCITLYHIILYITLYYIRLYIYTSYQLYMVYTYIYIYILHYITLHYTILY